MNNATIPTKQETANIEKILSMNPKISNPRNHGSNISGATLELYNKKEDRIIDVGFFTYDNRTCASSFFKIGEDIVKALDKEQIDEIIKKI